MNVISKSIGTNIDAINLQDFFGKMSIIRIKGFLSGFTIAFTIRSVDRSLSVRSIGLGDSAHTQRTEETKKRNRPTGDKRRGGGT